MAEALATASIIATTIQIFDFSTKVLSRIENYASNTKSLPKVFRNVQVRLPVLEDALQQTKGASKEGLIPRDTEKKIMPLVDGCLQQLKQLDILVTKALPQKDDGTVKRGLRAVGSLRYDSKVAFLYTEIEKDIAALQYHMTKFSGAESLAARPKAPLVASSNVPFRREPYFVNRPVLEQIESSCQQPASRTAIVGLGGVGKSQLAVEYSYRLRERQPETWVFWVHAGSDASFKLGYRNIADKVDISGWDDKDDAILKKVLEWLSTDTNGPWLMIIDNADEMDVFESTVHNEQDHHKHKRLNDSRMVHVSPAPNLADHLPQCQHGHYLITSRDRQAAFRLTGNYRDIINIEPMEEAEAVLLFEKRFASPLPVKDTEDTKELVRVLDFMPLAITQAASFINERSPRMTVRKYLDELKKGEIECGQLLSVHYFDLSRESKRTNSMIATWHISYEHIRRSRPSAARLLAHMSLFERSGIPEELCKEHYDVGTDSTAPAKRWAAPKLRTRGKDKKHGDQLDNFDEDWVILNNFSMIKTNIAGNSFEMHSLVQLTTRKWLLLHGQFKIWQEKYVVLINNNYPWPEIQDEVFEKCNSLLPHVTRAMKHEPSSSEPLRNWAHLILKFSELLKINGMYEEAVTMGNLALTAFESILGREHAETLEAVSQIGECLHKQSKDAEIEPLARRLFETRTKTLGPDHWQTISSMSWLSNVLMHLPGRREEALALSKRVKAAQEKSLGAESDAMRSTIIAACMNLIMLNEWAQIEVLTRRLLEARSDMYKEDSDEKFFDTNTLCMALAGQERFKEAEEPCRQVLKWRKKRFGDKAPETLTAMGNLSVTLMNQGKLKEAEQLQRHCWKYFHELRGEDHHETIDAMTMLAYVLYKSGQIDEAQELSTKLLENFGNESSPSHEWMLHTLSCIRLRQGLKDESLELHQSAINIAKDKSERKTFLHDYLEVQESIASEADEALGSCDTNEDRTEHHLSPQGIANANVKTSAVAETLLDDLSNLNVPSVELNSSIAEYQEAQTARISITE